MRKFDIFSLAHRRASNMRFFGDTRSYRELFAVALKVQHMMKRLITVVEINWLAENTGTKFLDLSTVRSLHISELFELKGGIGNAPKLTIYHHAPKQTKEASTALLGAVIASDSHLSTALD